VHGLRVAAFAGLRKGLCGLAKLAVFEMLAILGVAAAVTRGSEKPTFTLKFPVPVHQKRVKAPAQIPVRRWSGKSYFVPRPTTEERLLFTLLNTNSPPASSAFSQMASVFSQVVIAS
jgi:hypothetical protein